MAKEDNSASRRIVETLAERIQRGIYPVDSRLPAERDLAAEFVLDRSAVRAALSQLTQNGLIVRTPGCRPRVSAAARSLPAVRLVRRREPSVMQTIAVVLPQLEADHASQGIMRGISQVLRSQEAPYRPLIFNTDLHSVPSRALEQEACTAIVEEGIAGAIVWPTLRPESLDGWRRVQAQGHPVVFVDRYDEDFPCDFVGVDNYAAAKEAVEYLLRLGHTRIAHLGVNQKTTSIQERAAGYQDALRAAGASGASDLLFTLSPDALQRGVEEYAAWLLKTDHPPTAVFAINDRIAHILIALLEAQGKTVPGDFSVVGFDDEDQYSARPALLTTMRQPFERIGQRAAAMLLRRLGSSPFPSTFQQVLLPTPLVERSTCQILEKSL